MKKWIWIMVTAFILISGFIGVRFGSALFQEGNPTPILFGILKLELTNEPYQQIALSHGGIRFISKHKSGQNKQILIHFMAQKGWIYKEQMESGYLFERDGQSVVVETRLYTKHYLLWNVPLEAVNEGII